MITEKRLAEDVNEYEYRIAELVRLLKNLSESSCCQVRNFDGGGWGPDGDCWAHREARKFLSLSKGI